VFDMQRCFEGASAFKQDLCAWGAQMNEAPSPYVEVMFLNSGCNSTVETPQFATSPYRNLCSTICCEVGFVRGNDGLTCVDSDECAVGTDNCDANAACTNTVGSFECKCNDGYFDVSSDGVTCALDRVNLGKAVEFAILSKSGITTTPGSVVTGDMGTSPIAVTAITGFWLVLASGGTHSTTSGSSEVDGDVYGASHAAPTPANLGLAVFDMEAAFTDAAGRVNPSYVELGGGSIDYLTLAPGLYKWSTNVNFPNKLTFSGRATDVWILQIAGILYIGSGAEVLLAGGARAENIFWQVFGLVDVDTTAHLEGIFLVKTMMAFKTGSSLNGAALAQTAVTLQSTKIVKRSSNDSQPTPNRRVRYLRWQ